jgi:PAS domain S-box-containing protein
MPTRSSEQYESEIRELRRLIRDLVALSTTPAGWVGREAEHIADGIADILWHTLRADAVYVALHSGAPIRAVRCPSFPEFVPVAERLGRERGSITMAVETVSSGDNQSLRVVSCPIGLLNEEGFIAVGSLRAGFPNEPESLLISVAANQAAVAVQAAGLRSKAESERHRVQELLSHAPAAIGLMSGPDHRWLYVNDYHIHATGRTSASDFIGKTLSESLPEVDATAFDELLKNVYRTGKPYVGRETRIQLNRAHTGLPETAYFDFVYEPIRNTDGGVENILIHAVEVTEKVLARERIHQSEQQLRAIFETTPDCVKIVASDGTLLHMNRAGLEMLGAREPKDVVGKSVYSVIAPEHRAAFREFNERICRGERGNLEFELVALDGTRHHMESHAAPLQQPDGSLAHLAVTLDLTGRKLAARALRESEQRYQIATEAAPIMVWMSGTDKRCFYFNNSWLKFVGRSLEQEIGDGWADNVHRDDFDHCVRTYLSCFDARQPFQMEYRLRHHTGQYRWILDHGVPRYAPDGTFEGYVGGCLDIHEQKEASEYKHRLAAIVQSSDDAIISKNLQGIVTSWNPAAERIFGYTAEEMIGASILEIIPPELHDDETRILETISRGERIDHFETIRVTKSGERMPVSLTISPVRDNSGKIIGAAKIARDITAQKRIEHALRVTERLAAVGRLAATVAHEINNPLEAATNLLYLAKERAAKDDVRGFLAMAEEELDRVAHLTKQTLGFYRDTQAPSQIKLQELLNPLISVFKSRGKNKGVEIKPEILEAPEIFAVGGEIRQVIANLLSNSIDAVPFGGRIRVRVRSAAAGDRSGVRIIVADSGSGIDPEARERIFEPFFTTKKDVGTGLGLWVCKNIVDKHGGRISIRSRTDGLRSGTVFSVFLPSVPAEACQDVFSRAI